MTSRRPYWCPKTMKRRPFWCSKPILRELNSFLMQTFSFVPINLHRCWPRELKRSIAHFTFTVGNEAGVDLVLIQPCLLYYVNHVLICYSKQYFLSKIYIRKGRRSLSKQGQLQPHVHSKARTPSPQLGNGLFRRSGKTLLLNALPQSYHRIIIRSIAAFHNHTNLWNLQTRKN